MTVYPLPLTPSQLRQRAAADGLSRFALMLLSFFSGIVLFEPAPFEVLACVFLPLFFLAKIHFPPRFAFLAAMLVLLFIGGLMSSFMAPDFGKALTHILVTGFLGLTAVLIGVLIVGDPLNRIDLALQSYTFCAFLVAVLGILAYFGVLPLAGTFMLYDRVKSTFKDPNVFGAFLVLPLLLALAHILMGDLRRLLLWSIIFVGLLVGMFLSFSRGAWVSFALGAAVLAVLGFATQRSAAGRARIMFFSLAGIGVVTALLATLISVDQITTIFETRARLDQSYDIGSGGRFANQLQGLTVLIENPLGIGFAGFRERFNADPHNVYLQGFFTYGWLGGFAYIALVMVSLVQGLGASLRAHPWQPYALVVYTAFFGTCVEGLVIDSDHWRHWFFLLGCLWAFIALDAQARGSAPHGMRLTSSA